MSTDIATQVSDELSPLDPSFFEDYQQAAADQNTLPPDGSYQVRLPEPIPDSAFQTRKDPTSGQVYLEISVDLTIVGGDHEGYNARFIRFTTQPIPEFKKQGSGWVKTGKVFNASDAADLLQNFDGASAAKPQTRAEWESAIKNLAGRTSPSPVYLTWASYDKSAQGKAKYLKSKDFPTVAGERKNFIERTAQQPFDMKIKGEVKRINPGDSYRVYANLRLGRRGFAVKAGNS